MLELEDCEGCLGLFEIWTLHVVMAAAGLIPVFPREGLDANQEANCAAHLVEGLEALGVATVAVDCCCKKAQSVSRKQSAPISPLLLIAASVLLLFASVAYTMGSDAEGEL